MSEEYWIISVPGKSTPRQSFDEVCRATERDQLSVNYLFNIPDLKVKSKEKQRSSSYGLLSFSCNRLAHLIHLLHFRMILRNLIIISKGINKSKYNILLRI